MLFAKMILAFAQGWIVRIWDMARRYPGLALAVALLCVAGWCWHARGAALAERDQARATIAELAERTEAAKARIEAASRAMTAAADTIERTRNDQIARIAADRDALLDELRDRPTRAAAIAAAPAGHGEAPASGTGAGLFAEDAGFLVREAARADAVRSSLIACYAQYDAARDMLEGLQEGAAPASGRENDLPALSKRLN